MIDLNNVKEEFLNFCRNFYSALVNSSAFFFLKEKYYHLNPLYRKTLQVIGWVVFSAVLLYYPLSLLYFSSGHIRDFKTKQELLKDLMVVSTLRSTGATLFYSSKRDPVSLIREKARAMQIPEKQIQKIRKVNQTGFEKGATLGALPSYSQDVKHENHVLGVDRGSNTINISHKAEAQKKVLSAKATAVEVAMKSLNLKEVVQYGHQMEQFSNNIKLMRIHIQEDAKQKNYFNVSYILHIFRQANKQNKTKKETKL